MNNENLNKLISEALAIEARDAIKRFGDYWIDMRRTPAKIVGASRILGSVRWRQAI